MSSAAALIFYIPPCTLTPPNPLHHPPLDQPLRIEVQGQLKDFQKVLPEAPWLIDGKPSAFPQPSGVKLARLAFREIYGRDVQTEVAGDFVVRDEYMGWVMDEMSSKSASIEYKLYSVANSPFLCKLDNSTTMVSPLTILSLTAIPVQKCCNLPS